MDLSYEVVVVEVTEDRIYFELHFEHPESVSSGLQKDRMMAFVIDESFFCSKNSALSIQQYTEIMSIMPKMLPTEDIQ